MVLFAQLSPSCNYIIKAIANYDDDKEGGASKKNNLFWLTTTMTHPRFLSQFYAKQKLYIGKFPRNIREIFQDFGKLKTIFQSIKGEIFQVVSGFAIHILCFSDIVVMLLKGL